MPRWSNLFKVTEKRVQNKTNSFSFNNELSKLFRLLLIKLQDLFIKQHQQQ